MNTKLTPGQTVWVCHFTPEHPKTEQPSAVIREREFYHYETPNYAKGELRAVVGPAGKGFDALFGVAYKPESVHVNRELARLELLRKMDEAIDALATLRNEVCKP